MRRRRHGQRHDHRAPGLSRTPAHPLLTALLAAAAGRPPPPDGAVEVHPAPPGPADAVVAFAAHHVVSADVPVAEVLAALPSEDVGAPMDVRFLSWLGERIGAVPAMLDAVLVASAAPGGATLEPIELLERPDLAAHPRALRAARYRTETRVYADPECRSVTILGRGLAGRLEVSIEVDAAHRGAGLGRRLALAARLLAARGPWAAEPLFAQVSPGNAASLRAFLAAGYSPIGAEVLFLRPTA